MQDHCSRSPQGDGQIAAARSSRAIVVSRQQRDAIHSELLISLTRIGDVSILVDRGEYDEAAELAQEMRDVTRMLDDLGWDARPDEREAEFEITLGAADLARAVYQLQVRASGALVSEIPEAQATEMEYRDSLRAIAAYGAILTQLDRAVVACR